MPRSDDPHARLGEPGGAVASREPFAFLDGLAGESADEIRSQDWSRSPIGAPDSWPIARQILLRMVLGSAGPKLLLCGHELIVLHNDAYRPFLGKAFAEAIGRPFRDLRHDIWPQIGPAIEAALAGTPQLLVDQRGTTLRNGYEEVAYGTLCYTPIRDERGDVVAVLAEVYETTPVLASRDRLQDENERFYGLFADAPMLLAYCSGPHSRFDHVNQAFAGLFNNRPLVGLRLADAIPEAAEQGFVDLVAGVYSTGTRWVGREVPALVRNGTDTEPRLHFLDFICQPSRDQAGHITGVAFFGYDVTDVQHGRERADKLQAQLLHAARLNAMGTMAMTLAHELNQPLTAAANFLSAARRLLAPDRPIGGLADLLDEAEQQVQRSGEIIRRIRASASTGTMHPERVKLADAVARAAGLLDANGALQDIAVEASIDPSAAEVLADRVQLEQILLNLLRNAVQASVGRASSVVVASRAEGRMARIEVQDRGAGIPPDRVPTLFDALQPSTSGGLGVGLSVCRTMVEAQGGRIWTEAPREGGTVMVFTLPRTGAD